MIEQRTFGAPFDSPWNPVAGDLTEYAPPERVRPALAGLEWAGQINPLVTVLGTVRDECVPLSRSLEVWSRQKLPSWLTVQYLVLDDGSSDGPEAECQAWKDKGLPVRYARMRGPSNRDRSCTLAFNSAVRHLVASPLVMFQWWDRIPGSFQHLAKLVEPFRTEAGCLTSAVSRHIGGSSSLEGMTPEVLASTLGMVDWKRNPARLATLAGQIGSHCVPGQATESSGCVWPVTEFVALGGYDERYTDRASYVNVELFRRALQAGLRVLFVPEPHGSNFHQSHFHDSRATKTMGWLDDPYVKRNPDGHWGRDTPEFAW